MQDKACVEGDTCEIPTVQGDEGVTDWVGENVTARHFRWATCKEFSRESFPNGLVASETFLSTLEFSWRYGNVLEILRRNLKVLGLCRTT